MGTPLSLRPTAQAQIVDSTMTRLSRPSLAASTPLDDRADNFNPAVAAMLNEILIQLPLYPVSQRVIKDVGQTRLRLVRDPIPILPSPPTFAATPLLPPGTELRGNSIPNLQDFPYQ